MGILKINKYKILELLTALFVFVVIIDPADNLLRLKMPLFAALSGYCLLLFKKVNVKGLYPLFIFILICVLTSLIGFFRGVNTNMEFAVSIFKSFIMAILLFWANRLRVIEKMKRPSIIVGLLVIFIYISSFIFPAVVAVVYPLTMSIDSPWPIMMSTRTFVGMNFVSVFYKTSPLFLFVAAVYLHRSFYKMGSQKNNIFMVIISLSTLFMSGTRMNMLTCIALTGLAFILKLWQSKKGRILAVLSLFFGIILGVFVLFMLINDKGETSLDVKTTLAKAFYNGVDKDPLMLLFGQGAGATFDSLGIRGIYAVQSELTYFDVIRWFGVPLLFVLMSVYIYPIYLIYKKRNLLSYGNELIVAHVLYLFIAGTNPLLISSTGMFALLIMYSYALNPYYEIKNENSNIISNI